MLGTSRYGRVTERSEQAQKIPLIGQADDRREEKLPAQDGRSQQENC